MDIYIRGGEEMVEIKPINGRIDMGGYKLHVNCYGKGDQTVLFESGLGHGSEDWTEIQAEISKVARTFSYDRAGIGNSDATKSRRTSLVQVRALHNLLDKVKVKGPYIIVAHSIGGFNARLFAATYPKEVAGIVFVDSSHENQFVGLRGNQLKEAKETLEGIEHSFDVILSANEVKKIRDKDALRNKPIVILKAIQRMSNQNDLVTLSNRSKLVLVKDSGHFIHSDKPQVVLDAIKELIEKTTK
jgi:pimeloyl-ACP methyl ester carboxylesterase